VPPPPWFVTNRASYLSSVGLLDEEEEEEDDEEEEGAKRSKLNPANCASSGTVFPISSSRGWDDSDSRNEETR